MNLAGIPAEFFLFAAVLAGIALAHRHALPIAVTGLLAIVAYRWAGPGSHEGGGLPGLMAHLHHEWVTLANLLGLLIGFALLAQHFEASRAPESLRRLLPRGWASGWVLLVLVFVISGFLDNIAAAVIGASMAASVYGRRLHTGYLAAIVAASNAGGAGSVLGDTTTTMMWISGVAPEAVLRAYVPAVTALLVFGIPAALQQSRHAPMVDASGVCARVDLPRLFVVLGVLLVTLVTNLTVNGRYPEYADAFPYTGTAVVASLLLMAPLRAPDASALGPALKSAVFLLSLVLSASFMPVESLPPASAASTFVLGLVSSVFDNIPLTALALKQGGYDWAALAYAVGFGGSMIWFGSSAGVAVSSLFPQARSLREWMVEGWHVLLAYVAGYLAFMVILGWQPR